MPTIIKLPNEEIYVFSTRRKLEFKIGTQSSGYGRLQIGSIEFPKEDIGKIIRLKVEFVKTKTFA